MTNFEYWKDRILEITNGNDPIALKNGEPMVCCEIKCEMCGLDSHIPCNVERIKWLYSEHVKTPKLTKRERKLCEALGTGWIAADKSGRVFWFDSLPMKGEYSHVIKSGNCICMSDAGFYFEFMDFEDKEPWMVENLLLLEVEE